MKKVFELENWNEKQDYFYLTIKCIQNKIKTQYLVKADFENHKQFLNSLENWNEQFFLTRKLERT